MRDVEGWLLNTRDAIQDHVKQDLTFYGEIARSGVKVASRMLPCLTAGGPTPWPWQRLVFGAVNVA